MKITSTTVIDLATKTKNVFVWQVGEDVTAIEKAITKLLNKGAQRVDKDGTKTWVEYQPVVDTSKEGSDQYTWGSDGNRCLHERVVYRLPSLGELERTVTGRSYRRFE